MMRGQLGLSYFCEYLTFDNNQLNMIFFNDLISMLKNLNQRKNTPTDSVITTLYVTCYTHLQWNYCSGGNRVQSGPAMDTHPTLFVFISPGPLKNLTEPCGKIAPLHHWNVAEGECRVSKEEWSVVEEGWSVTKDEWNVVGEKWNTV